METPEHCMKSDQSIQLSCQNIVIEHRLSGVFTCNFEQISHIILMFPLVTLNKQMLAKLLMFAFSLFTSSTMKMKEYIFHE